MPKQNEPTTKFKVDISELKAGIQEANRQIRLANSEFKAASAGMENWGKSADGVSAKLKQLQTVLTAETTKLNNLKKQYQLVAAEQGENSKAAQELMIKINNQQAAVNRVTSDIGKYTKELDSIENSSKDASNSTEQLDDSLEEVEDTANSLGNGGFTVLKGALASLVADGFRMAIDAAKDFATSMITTAAEVKAQNSQYAQTFGEMANSADEAIARVAGSTGILDTRLKGSATAIYGFAKASGAEVPEAMSLMETALMAAADNAAYYDRSLADSTETLQSFMKGNFENDAALGVSATEFTRNAAAAKLFGKEYNDLTEIQKQQTLLQMVVDAQKAAGAFGQASRESDGWENVMGNLNEAWKQFKAQVGAPFLEAIIPVVQNITTAFKGWADSVDWDAFSQKVTSFTGSLRAGFQWFIDNKDIIITGFTMIGTAVATYLVVGKITAFISAIKLMVAAFAGAPTVIAGVKAAMAALNITMVANPIGLVVAAITALVAGFVVAYNKVEWFRNGVNAAWEVIKNAVLVSLGEVVTFFTTTLPNAFDSAVTAISQLPAKFSTWLTNILTNVSEWVTSMVTKAKELGTDFVNAIVTFITTLPDKFYDMTVNVLGHLLAWDIKLYQFATTKIPEFVNKIMIYIRQLPGKIKTQLTTAFNNIVTWGVNIIKTGLEKSSAFLTAVMSFIQQLPGKLQIQFTNALNNAIQWGINTVNTGRQKASEFVTKVIGFISKLPGKLKDKLTKAYNKIVDWARDMVKKGKEAAKDTVDGIMDGFKDLPGKLKQAGIDALNGFWNGLKEVGARIKKWATDFFNSILDKAKEVLDIASPSKAFKKIGKFVMQGFDIGMTDESKKTLKNTKSIFSGVLGNARSSLSSTASRIRSIAANSGFTPAMAGAGNITNNFYQTNNSPKSLSRLEIYRQTRNLLSLKGVK